MFIVGCHPDNGAGPYVEDAQLPVEETDALMATVRRSREEEGDQFGGSGHNPFLPACFFGASLVGWVPKLPADLLLLQYLFRHPGSMHPHTTERIRVQLAEFYRAINPYSDTLAKFPALFWILPVPFEILESRVNWCYKLEVARIFFCLIKDGLSPQLECAMITFFWPEIQEDPSLLEVVSTSRASAAGARKKSCASVLGGVSCDKHVVRIRPEGPSHIYIYICVCTQFHIISPYGSMLQSADACLVALQPRCAGGAASTAVNAMNTAVPGRHTPTVKRIRKAIFPIKI